MRQPLQSLTVGLRHQKLSTIDVLVGSEETRFTITELLIIKKVKMFKTALQNPMSEGRTRIIKIPERSPKDFDSFLHHLYHGQFDRDDLYGKTNDEKCMFYARMYVLADYVDCSEVAKAAESSVETLIAYRQKEENDEKGCPGYYFPSPEVVKYIYDNTLRGVHIRRLLVAQRLWMVEWKENGSQQAAEEQDESLEVYHPVFLSELAGYTIRKFRSGGKNNPFYSHQWGVEYLGLRSHSRK